MKNNFGFILILLVLHVSKSIYATPGSTNKTVSFNNISNISNFTSNVSSNNSATDSDNIHTKAASPKPENKIDIGELITLFTKPTTSTTTTTTSAPTTSSPTNSTSTPCICGKRGKASSRDDESHLLHDSNLNKNDIDDYTKIVNGTVSTTHAWPWSVAFVNVTSNPNYVMCGGSLISADYILSAGHCFNDITNKAKFLKDIRVYLGTNKINGNSTLYSPVKVSISNYKVHPKYTTAPNFDVAVVRLATPVTFNSSIRPVCLSQTGKPFAGKNVTAVGWGDTFTNQSKGSNVLREVGLRVLGNTACNTTANGGITPQMICTISDPVNKGICNGDSGGGLFYKKPTANTFTVIGISSFYIGSCKSPSVFTRVSSVIDFIKGATMNSTTYCSNTFFP